MFKQHKRKLLCILIIGIFWLDFVSVQADPFNNQPVNTSTLQAKISEINSDSFESLLSFTPRHFFEGEIGETFQDEEPIQKTTEAEPKQQSETSIEEMLKSGLKIIGPDGSGVIEGVEIIEPKNLSPKIKVRLQDGTKVTYFRPTLKNMKLASEAQKKTGQTNYNFKDFENYIASVIEVLKLNAERVDYGFSIEKNIIDYEQKVKNMVRKFPEPFRSRAFQRLRKIQEVFGNAILLAAFNTQDLLALISPNKQGTNFLIPKKWFKLLLEGINDRLKSISTAEILGTTKDRHELTKFIFPILWKAILYGNIKDQVFKNAQAEIRKLKENGIDMSPFVNLNDPVTVDEILQEYSDLEIPKDLLDQEIQSNTGYSLEQVVRQRILIDIYADEIAQAIGSVITKLKKRFQSKEDILSKFQNWANLLVFEKRKGIEYKISPRNLKEINYGNICGDCTATISNAQPGVAQNFWTTPMWLADQTHFILTQYLDGKFYGKYGITIIQTSDSAEKYAQSEGDFALFVHALEISAKSTTGASIFQPPLQHKILVDGVKKISSIARKAGIKQVYFLNMSNTDWVNQFLVDYFPSSSPIFHVEKFGKTELPSRFLNLDEHGPMLIQGMNRGGETDEPIVLLSHEVDQRVINRSWVDPSYPKVVQEILARKIEERLDISDVQMQKLIGSTNWAFDMFGGPVESLIDRFMEKEIERLSLDPELPEKLAILFAEGESFLDSYNEELFEVLGIKSMEEAQMITKFSLLNEITKNYLSALIETLERPRNLNGVQDIIINHPLFVDLTDFQKNALEKLFLDWVYHEFGVMLELGGKRRVEKSFLKSA